MVILSLISLLINQAFLPLWWAKGRVSDETSNLRTKRSAVNWVSLNNTQTNQIANQSISFYSFFLGFPNKHLSKDFYT